MGLAVSSARAVIADRDIYLMVPVGLLERAETADGIVRRTGLAD